MVWNRNSGDRVFRDPRVSVDPGELRRNNHPRRPLNRLIGRRLRVGGTIFRGVKLCEPCRHFMEVTGKSSLLSMLVHRGGLHAQVIEN